jgi:hypothetical protein
VKAIFLLPAEFFLCYRTCSCNLAEIISDPCFKICTLVDLQTPEGSLLDIMRNAHDLLSSCGIDIPMVIVLLYLVCLWIYFTFGMS